MNQTENPTSGTPAHKIHGLVILFTTGLFYLIFFLRFDSSDGGGQPVLPGMGKVVAFILVILTTIISIYQLIVFRTIRRSRRMSLANIMLALPLVVMLPICMSSMEMPDRYSGAVFLALLAAVLLQFFAIRRRNSILAGVGYAIMAVTLFECADWSGRSAENSRWWENGTVTTYYANGMKQTEAEQVVEGRATGNFTQWNEDGSLLAFDRYPEGHLKPADSSVDYHRGGAIQSISYIFDSAGISYKRRVGYTEDGRLRTFNQSTTSLDTQFYRSETYDRETGELRNLDYNFDSAGERYRRALSYDDQGLRWIHFEGWRKGTRYVRKFPRHK